MAFQLVSNFCQRHSVYVPLYLAEASDNRILLSDLARKVTSRQLPGPTVAGNSPTCQMPMQ